MLTVENSDSENNKSRINASDEFFCQIINLNVLYSSI